MKIERNPRRTDLDKADKQAVIEEYRSHETDTGSTESQIAVLTARITELTQHLREHKHDESTRRGLLRLVGRRRSLLKYLNSENVGRYRALVAKLGLRK
jgi:small subunit ribosomal protein S15